MAYVKLSTLCKDGPITLNEIFSVLEAHNLPLAQPIEVTVTCAYCGTTRYLVKVPGSGETE